VQSLRDGPAHGAAAAKLVARWLQRECTRRRHLRAIAHGNDYTWKRRISSRGSGARFAAIAAQGEALQRTQGANT
jgi:hypothetical protein